MSPALHTALMWLMAFAGIVLSAIASGGEIAFYSLNRVRLSLRTDRPAMLLKAELERPDRLLATMLIWLNVATYFSAMATSKLLEGLGSPALIAVVNTCILAPILFVFAEALPKDLFRIEANRIAYRLATPLTVGRLVLTGIGLLPLVQLLIRGIEVLMRLPHQGSSDARQRIALLLKEGAVSGALSESQVTLVDRALLLRGVHVGDEMVPWSAVRWVPLEADRPRMLRLLAGNTHSRIPVVGTIERQRSGASHQGVIGVLRQIDLYLNPESPITALVQPIVRLKRHMGVREALLLLREHKAGMGIVEDDAGRPLGVVTPADLIEPLTGQMTDV